MSFRNIPFLPARRMTSFLRKRTEEGARARYSGTNGTPTYEAARPQLERELALIEKLQARRLFPDRLGHRSVLSPGRNFDSGTWLCSQQCRLLFTGDYGRRSDRYGTFVRAISF